MNIIATFTDITLVVVDLNFHVVAHKTFCRQRFYLIFSNLYFFLHLLLWIYHIAKCMYPLGVHILFILKKKSISIKLRH